MLLTHAFGPSASQFMPKKKSARIYTSAHLGGLELTQLTYSRHEDNLHSLQVTIKTNLLAELMHKHRTKSLTHQTGNYSVTCFVSRPSGITLVKFHSLQVTIKTNLLACYTTGATVAILSIGYCILVSFHRSARST